MKRIKLALSRLAPAATARVADTLASNLNGNANVPNPDPPLATLQLKAEAIRSKEAIIKALLTALSVERSELRALNLELKHDLRREADHVQAVCGGVADKLLSTGLAITADPLPRGPLAQVEGFKARRSDHVGQLLLRWAPVSGAACYMIETALSEDGPWTMAHVTTRADHQLTGLVPGTKYWVRVRAIGTTGLGPWSNPLCKMAA